MSANNWGYCPKCKKERGECIARLKKKAGEKYGKVTPEKYLELLDKADNQAEIIQTLREDYDIYIDVNGNFYIGYIGRCKACGFKHEFKHEETLSI